MLVLGHKSEVLQTRLALSAYRTEAKSRTASLTVLTSGSAVTVDTSIAQFLLSLYSHFICNLYQHIQQIVLKNVYSGM
jgi:hypothetical protein